MSDRNSRQINQFFATFIAKLRKWLIKIGSPFHVSRRFIRSLLNQTKGQTKKRSSQAGFVLPTVTLVTLIVTLVVVATVARSSDRARTAANSRVDQALRAVTTPAIDRARSKIDKLLSDDALGRGTPSDTTLYNAFNNAAYTLQDEIRLQIVQDRLDGTNGSIGSTEAINTAWKYPIDTDNNGLYDTFGIYSIQFKTRPTDATGIGTRTVAVTEARTPPMDDGATTGACANSGGSGVAEGWYSSNGKQKKAFFVYAATVPITQDSGVTATSQIPGVSSTNAGKFEFYKGNKGFTALELQQDRSRTPLNNNAVWFEDDLELARPATFRLNGRIFTNSNLMVGAGTGSPINFYQVSSPSSCYYNADNAKILIAGNVVLGDTITDETTTLGAVNADLYQGSGSPPLTNVTISNSTNTVSNSGRATGFNNDAFNRRITALRLAAKARTATPKYPKSVQDDMASGTAEDSALTTYFKNRLHKVPFLECPFGSCTGATGSNPSDTAFDTQAEVDTFLSGSGASTLSASNGVLTVSSGIELSPPEKWMLPPYGSAPGGYALGMGISFPTGTAGTASGNTITTGDLTFSGTNISATDPTTLKNNGGNEAYLGDRVLVGNNLPGLWYNTSQSGLFAGKSVQNLMGTGVNWTNPATTPRYTSTQIDTLADLGDFSRDGFWEKSASASPTFTTDTVNALSASERQCTTGCNNISPVYGGLRVVTGAGIYSSRNADSFLTTRPPTLSDTTNTVIDTYVNSETSGATAVVSEAGFNNFLVWPDSMPMTGAVRWLDSTTYPSRATAGYYPPLNPVPNPAIADMWAANGTANIDNRRGDLQMRATAVYHYKTSVYDSITPVGYQAPIACVSSYYDPTNATTAQNKSAWGSTTAQTLVDVGYGLSTSTADKGRSNNGVTYAVPSTTASNLSLSGITYGAATGLFGGYAAGAANPADTTVLEKDRLVYQANLVFPNGRFVNPQLRAALKKVVDAGGTASSAGLSLAQQAAIDSSICALEINTGEISPSTTLVPHATFREASFLDAREVKSLNKDETAMQNSAGQTVYDLEIEQRQPLEIRATDIDINKLRTTTITGANNNAASTATPPGVPTDYLLPYSGLVYASRDDGYEDLSDNSSTNLTTRKSISPTDFKLDPTRRPNAIRLINGSKLWRGTGASQGNWSVATKGEKGLVLVTNLPSYIKGDFNLHTKQEFTTALATDWSNFYTRTTIDPDFACRPDSSGISPKPSCTTGDEWRAATIISDSPTVLSGTSKDGFRNNGDFDLRNNADTNYTSYTAFKNLRRGFWNNNFVTNADWANNNGGANDFYPYNNRNTYLANGVTPVQRRLPFGEYSMEICRKLPVTDCGPNDWTSVGAGTTVLPTLTGTPTATEPWGTGTLSTTPRYIHPDDLRFPRRIAFLRNGDLYSDAGGTNDSLVLSPECLAGDQAWPIPIGVNNGNTAPSASGGYTYGYVNTLSNCQTVLASSSSATARSLSSASLSATSVSASASISASISSSASASTSLGSSASSSRSSAAISSSSSASIASSTAASNSSTSASSSSASAVSASNRSVSSASSAASSVSASAASVSVVSRSSSSASSASVSSVSSAASSVSSASSLSRSSSSATVASRSSSSASTVSLRSSSSASAVSASASSAISSTSTASSASLSSSSRSIVSASSASSAASSVSSASRVSTSSSSASTVSASSSSVSRVSTSSVSASSSSVSTVSASSSSVSAASSASVASVSSSSASLVSRSAASVSAVSASASSASSSSRSVASAAGNGMLRVPTIGGVMPKMPIAAMLPSVHGMSYHRIGAAFPTPGATNTSGTNTYPPAIPTTFGAASTGNVLVTKPGFDDTVPSNSTVGNRGLWFRTTATKSDGLGDTTKVRYDDGLPLYMYVPTSSNGIAKQDANKALLPDTLCLQPNAGAASVVACNLAAPSSTFLSLNSNYYDSGLDTVGTTAPSDFAVCTYPASGTNTGFQGYKAAQTTSLNTTCSSSTLTQIDTFRTGLEGLTAANTTPTILSTSNSITSLSLTATGAVAVYDLPYCQIGVPTGGTATISLTASNPDTVFVLRTNKATCAALTPTQTSTQFGVTGLSEVKLSLNGVSPNNVFWVIGAGGGHPLTFNDPGSSLHTIVSGNFLGAGSLSANTIPDNVEIRGGRFLGWSNALSIVAAPASPASPVARFIAVTSDDEPLVLPILQVHAPGVQATGSGATLTQTGLINGDPLGDAGTRAKWTEGATETTVNAYFVSGNTPSRAFVDYTAINSDAVAAGTAVRTGETGGGLHNFIRYLENWRDNNGRVNSFISGGFIQNRRSVFATAPYSATAPYTDLTKIGSAIELAYSPPDSSDIQSLFKDASDGISQKYYRSQTTQVLPYYDAPNRQWGYDVGLLTQPPDLFALRFSGAVPTPNEFFREVDRNDNFVQALLCALQPSGVAGNTTKQFGGSAVAYGTYTEFAVPRTQRESGGTTCSNIPGYTPGPSGTTSFTSYN